MHYTLFTQAYLAARHYGAYNIVTIARQCIDIIRAYQDTTYGIGNAEVVGYLVVVGSGK